MGQDVSRFEYTTGFVECFAWGEERGMCRKQTPILSVRDPIPPPVSLS